MLGEQLDDLLLDEGRVDVHDDEAAAAAGQAGRGHGDVDADSVRPPARGRARRSATSAPGDVELDGRHGVARQPPDAVDVGAVVGDRRGDGGDVVRSSGAPMTTTAARPVRRGALSPRPTSRSTRIPSGRPGPGQPVDEHVLVAARGEQHRQREVAAHDDLLDVEHLGADGRGRLEQRLGHPGPVGAVEGDEQGSRVRVGQGSAGAARSGRGAPVQATGVGVPPRDEVTDRTEVVVAGRSGPP